MSRLVSCAVALGCLSYPVTTVALLQTGAPIGTVNVGIKAVFALLYASIVVAACRKRLSIPVNTLPLLLFFALYGLDLLWDILVVGVEMDGYSSAYILLYFFALTALPVTAICLSARALHASTLHAWVLGGLILSNIALIFQVLTAETVELLTMLASRAQVTHDDPDLAVLSPLTYGYMGSALAAFSLARLCLIPGDGAFRRISLLTLTFLGLANLIMGASRGPFFGLVLALLFLGWRLAKTRASKDEPPRMHAWALLGLPVLALSMLSISDQLPTFFFERLFTFAADRSSGIREERDYQFAGALRDFVESPIFGRHFVSSYDHFYPHNVPLEVLMATGAVGGSLFALAVAALFISLRRLLLGMPDRTATPLATAGICILSSGLTSGSIHSAPEFWILFALLTCLGVDKASTERSTGSKSA
jgi:hypothetical protein